MVKKNHNEKILSKTNNLDTFVLNFSVTFSIVGTGISHLLCLLLSRCPFDQRLRLLATELGGLA